MNEKGFFIFPTNQKAFGHNKEKLLELNTNFPIARLSAICQGPHAKSVQQDKTGGLSKTLYLCKNAKVTLTANLSVKCGLFNRAPGTVVDIIYLNGKKPQDSLPDVVMVEFSTYNGPPFIQDKPKLIPIVPIERHVDCNCFSCKRKQTPLRLGWAASIHSCQGLTVGIGETNRYIIIDPGTKAFESRSPGALFVALSRAKSAGDSKNDPDFAWHSSVLVNEDRLCHVPNTPAIENCWCICEN